MGYLLGFGIPIAYIVTGLFLSRAVYRSRYKRGHTAAYDDVDTTMTCIMMGVFWPVFALFYFPIVWFRGTTQTAFHRFYTSNLPETNAQKEVRARQKEWDYRNKIHKLELDCGLTPTEKYVEERPTERRKSRYGYGY